MSFAKKVVLNEKIDYFCKNSTLHGVSYLRRSEKYAFVTWAIVLASSISLCLLLGQMIWMKFSIDPTFTVVESTHFLTSDIPFPWVVACNGDDTIYGPNTVNITNVLLLRGYQMGDIDRFYKSFNDIKLKDYTPDVGSRKIHEMLDDIGFSYDVLLAEFKKPCNVLLVKCSWRSQTYNCSQMFREMYTAFGYCCAFDLAYFKLNVDSTTRFTSGVDPSQALELVVDVQRYSHTGTVTDGNIYIFVSNEDTEVNSDDSGIIVSSGALFDINLELSVTDSSDEVKALSLDDRKCTLTTNPGDRPGFFDDCISRRRLEDVVAFCKCLPFNYTSSQLHVDVYQKCTWERMTCIYQTWEKYLGDSSQATQFECYQRCDYVLYGTQMEYIKYQRSVRTVNKSHAQVTVHFSDNSCMKYRREVLYSWDQMLANLGGIFGLCLGGSIISLFEIIWFILDLLLTLLIKEKIKPNEKESIKVFSITERNKIKKVTKKETHGRYRFAN